MKIVEDRRRHKRYNLSGSVFIHNKATNVNVGQVIDIGIGGLKVYYDDPKNTVEPWHWRIKRALLPRYKGYYNVSVTNNGEECGLEQVQCATVGDAVSVITSPIGNGGLKCIGFAPLGHAHVFYLNQLIRKHAVTIVEDRRKTADREKLLKG